MPIMTCNELNAVWIIKLKIEREQRRLRDLQILAEPSVPKLDGMSCCRSKSDYPSAGVGGPYISTCLICSRNFNRSN